MIFHSTAGVKNCTGFERVPSCPLYLTDDFEILEGPSLWALDVAKRGSVSKETLKQYTSTLARFLSWLNTSLKAENWLMVADETMDSYVSYLIGERDEEGRPDDTSIEFYVARIADFYRWALENGYPVKWDMDLKKVKYKLRDLGLRAAVTVTRTGLERRLTRGVHADILEQKHLFMTDTQLLSIRHLFADKVYSIMAFMMRNVGLRPKEVLQLPYMGKGLNIGLHDYRPGKQQIPASITYEFESKGKRRKIEIPGKLWQYVCDQWMPERIERVNRLAEQGKEVPSISHLFIDIEGTPVTYPMLWGAFAEIVEHPARPEGLLRCRPKMLRHAFATYFVYNALKKKGALGKPYVYDVQIDEQLRHYMGHRRLETTYKFYVHLAAFLSGEDVMGPVVEHVVEVLLPDEGVDVL
jgi:site-specific recombinase XerD